MEIRVLKYFLAVVREENILRASEVLHITQPSLSRQLAQLEGELGVRLFVRGNRRITLTAEGILLKRRAEEIVALSDKTEKEFADLARGEDIAGIVAIGGGEISSVSRLSALMREFNVLHPKVNFSFYSGTADVVKDQIDKGILDFGLLLEPVEFAKYDHFSMGIKEKWVVLMRPDSPLAENISITKEDLSGRKLILPSREIVQKELAVWFGDTFRADNVIVSKNLMNNGALMVEQGLGYAIGVENVPSMYDPKRFCYRELSPEITTGSVLVWKKDQPHSRAAEEFLKFVSMSIGHSNI